MASYEDLKKQFQGIATAAGSTTGEIDDDVLDKIIAGTHGSYSVADDTIVRRPGEGYVAPESTPRDTSTRSRNDMRRELLLPDYRKQAAQQVNPQFDRLTNQLQSQIAATRGRIPRQLLARGQAVGGQRTLQEGELDRQLAYGTADLEAQRQMAINQAAQGLRQQGLEEQRYQDQVAFRDKEFAYGKTQDQINNSLRQREMQLKEEGLSDDQAYREAQLELQENTLDENIRQFDEQQSYKYWLGNKQYSGGTTGTTQEPSFDIRAYTPMLNNLYQQDPGQVIPYINNLEREGVPQEAIQELRRIYGVQSTTTPTSQSQQGRVGGRMDMGGTTSSSVITPYIPPEPQFQEEPEEINYPLSYLEAKEDVLSTATDMNGNVNAEIVAQQVDALVAAGQISPDVARAIYSPYAQQE